MDFNDYLTEVQKKHSKKQFMVHGSWGVYDAYKAIRKAGWYDIGKPVKEHEFYSIIRQVNKLLAEEIVHGNTVVFPSRMGKLELVKHECGAVFKDGELKITYPIDWHGTLALWYEDKEAERDKVLLRHDTKYAYKVRYNKHDAVYENKTFYKFVLNRGIKHELQKHISEGKTDTLW